MSQPRGALSQKRKRPVSDGGAKDLKPEDRMIYNLIRSKGDMGIWKGDIKKELNIANARVVDNCVKSLLTKQMIKEVPDIQSKGKKRLMAMEFEPSKDLTGGVWYDQGTLDKELIDSLKRTVRQCLLKMKVATAAGLCNAIKKLEVFQVDLTLEQVQEILENMVLDKMVLKTKSNGLGDYVSFPINSDCYKLKPRHTKVGALASLPCGVCPRINQCTPDGIISPATCEYYKKWLDF